MLVLVNVLVVLSCPQQKTSQCRLLLSSPGPHSVSSSCCWGRTSVTPPRPATSSHVTQHQGWQPPSPHIWPSWTDRFICFFSCAELLDIFCCCCWTIYCSYSSLVVGSIDLPTSACLHPCAEQWGKCNIVFVISVCINSASISILKLLCNIIVWILYCLRSRPIYLNVVS